MTNKASTNEITARVISKTEKKTNEGTPFWRFELIQDGQTFGFGYSLFDFKAGEFVGVGETWRFDVSEKPNPKGGVYRNVEKVLGKAPVEEVPPTPVFQSAPDLTRQSIERQTALKAAVELAGYLIAKGRDTGLTEVLAAAEQFAGWLQGLERSVPAPATQNSSTKPIATPRTVVTNVPVGPPLTKGELFTWAQNFLHMTRQEVLTALNAKTLDEITDLGQAWATLKLLKKGE